jgi:hypothetical protein
LLGLVEEAEDLASFDVRMPCFCRVGVWV